MDRVSRLYPIQHNCPNLRIFHTNNSFVAPPFLNLWCTPFVRPILDYFMSPTLFTLSFVVCIFLLCRLEGSPMWNITSFGCFFPLHESPLSNELFFPFMDPMCPKYLILPSTITSLRPVHTPFLVLIAMTLYGCANGVIQPLWCAHAAKGRQVHSLGVLPSCPILSQMQPKSPSSISREEGCVPPWDWTSPLCPKVLLPMPIRQVLS